MTTAKNNAELAAYESSEFVRCNFLIRVYGVHGDFSCGTFATDGKDACTCLVDPPTRACRTVVSGRKETFRPSFRKTNFIGTGKAKCIKTAHSCGITAFCITVFDCSTLRFGPSARSDHHRKAADAVVEFAEGLECLAGKKVVFRFKIAETLNLHLLGGGAESLRTDVVHGQEAECLGKRYPVCSGVQEFDLRSHFPKHGPQSHLGGRSLRNRALREEGRTSGKGKTLNDSDKLLGVNGE
jgi:hypothetical protein